MQRHSGFALIELITVIVILGILSAFALPRFAGLEAHARAASLEGLAGSVRGGAALTHSLWLARGDKPTRITMEGVAVAMNTLTGYPDDGDTGIRAVIASSEGFTFAPTSGGRPGYEFGIAGITDTTHCKITYLLGTTAGAPPTVTVDGTACE